MADSNFIKTFWHTVRATVKWGVHIATLPLIAVLHGIIVVLTHLTTELTAWGTTDPVVAPTPAPPLFSAPTNPPAA